MTTTLAAQTIRKGARRRAEIPPDILARLNRGELEAITLVEGLAIDFSALLQSIAPKLPADVFRAVSDAAATGITRRMALVGRLLLEHLGVRSYLALARHRSDTVRGWAAFLLASAAEFTLRERIWLVRALANDANPGVREWAWLALRPHVAEDVEHAIRVLEPWTSEPSPFLRRFASEITRPRGVWCAQIESLKKKPSLGLPILEPLRSDPHRYVQNSVANWLNDAGKSQPEWVSKTCRRWQKESRTPATDYICRRAQRNLKAA